MGSKRSSIVEGVAYFFALTTLHKMHATRDAIEAALMTANCGRVIGSGTSLSDEGTYSIEFETYNPEAARGSIERVCSRKRIGNYEVVHD
jgi:hypothetical protein